MANAAVENLKGLGLRHGEKAVVGLMAALFVASVGYAFSRQALEMKPEELASAANAASSNLAKQQPVPDVLDKLEKAGLTDPKLVQVVESQFKNALKADNYKTRLEWVTPEPGAGLIRDQPELIAPTELASFPGRGGILLYPLDENKERIPLSVEDKSKKGGKSRKKEKEEKPEDKKRRELEEQRKKDLFAGKTESEKEQDKTKEEVAAEGDSGPWKEDTKGQRWVVITGVIDNEQLKKNYLMALKNPAVAYPNYKRLDIERRQLLSEGGWTKWDKVDRDKSYDILENLPELESEVVPEPKRLEALVDHLPFLKAGYWTGVHVAKLVPPEILAKPKAPPGGMEMGMGMGGMAGPGGSSSRPGGGSFEGALGQEGAGRGSSSMPGNRGGMLSAAGGGSGSGGGGPVEDLNFDKSDEKSLMLRVLDFTVEQDHSYQFRLRIVVVNPNKDRTDVNPGVDIDSTELLGPWSEPTDPVTVPADVAAYAQAPEPAARRDDLVNFQVIKFDTETGQTVIKLDGAGPGEMIGEFGSVQEPSSKGDGPVAKNFDFNSRAIVLDTFGGFEKLPDIGLDRNNFLVPALAMIIEPDGSVVIRDQAFDRSDPVRDDMEENYKQALADSDKKRQVGSGSRMPGAGGDPRFGRGKSRGSGGGRAN
jgi:hypothetical protein